MILGRRAMQRRAVWDLLTGTLSEQRAAPAALQNHQGRFTGIVGRSFRQLVQSLEQGSSLLSAIGQHRCALPVEAQAYAAMDAVPTADPVVTSTPTAARQNHREAARQNIAGQQLYQRFAYLGGVLLIMLSVITFLMFKIIPSYQAIFDDFNLELPAITIALIAASNLSNSSGVVAMFFLSLAGILLLGALAAVMALCDVAVLRPLTDRLFFTKHRALVLRLLAVATERGQPMATVLQQLAEGKQRYPSRLTRGRLGQVQRAVSAGQDWRQAMCRAALLKNADLPMLKTAQQTGNLPWVLRMLADQKVRLMIFRWSTFEQIAFPITVLLMGLVVLWICVALFIPLVALIYCLA